MFFYRKDKDKRVARPARVRKKNMTKTDKTQVTANQGRKD